MGSIPIPGKCLFFSFVLFCIETTDDVTSTTERAPWETDIYLQRLGRWQLYNEYEKIETENFKILLLNCRADIWKLWFNTVSSLCFLLLFR